MVFLARSALFRTGYCREIPNKVKVLRRFAQKLGEIMGLLKNSFGIRGQRANLSYTLSKNPARKAAI